MLYVLVGEPPACGICRCPCTLPAMLCGQAALAQPRGARSLTPSLTTLHPRRAPNAHAMTCACAYGLAAVPACALRVPLVWRVADGGRCPSLFCCARPHLGIWAAAFNPLIAMRQHVASQPLAHVASPNFSKLVEVFRPCHRLHLGVYRIWVYTHTEPGRRAVRKCGTWRLARACACSHRRDAFGRGRRRVSAAQVPRRPNVAQCSQSLKA